MKRTIWMLGPLGLTLLLTGCGAETTQPATQAVRPVNRSGETPPPTVARSLNGERVAYEISSGDAKLTLTGPAGWSVEESLGGVRLGDDAARLKIELTPVFDAATELAQAKRLAAGMSRENELRLLEETSDSVFYATTTVFGQQAYQFALVAPAGSARYLIEGSHADEASARALLECARTLQAAE